MLLFGVARLLTVPATCEMFFVARLLNVPTTYSCLALLGC